jgi:cyclic pyranopterin phosphate synthase
MSEKALSHFDEQGRVHMVNVGGKDITERWAVARAALHLSAETLELVRQGHLKKGDLRAAAELAGVMAAKRTWELIPLCHPLELTQVEVEVGLDDDLPGLTFEATARATGRTGVEMEALTAVSVAALTAYDMLKSVERSARITDIRLVEKHGGRSGDLVMEAG